MSAALSEILASIGSSINAMPTTSSVNLDQYDSACASCSYVFPVSMVGIVAQWSFDMYGSMMTTDGTSVLATMTQEIGTVTRYADGRILQGAFSTPLASIVPTSVDWSFTMDEMVGTYSYSYISTLSTIISKYTSWQDLLLTKGVCMEMPNILTLPSVVTFLSGDFSIQDASTMYGTISGDGGNITQAVSIGISNTISASAIQTRLPVPTCTTTSLEGSTRIRSIPTFIGAIQSTAVEVDALIVDSQIPASAKIALGALFGFGVGIILSFLAFFLWKRRRTSRQQRHRSLEYQSVSRLASNDSGRSSKKTYDVSVSELTTSTSRPKDRTWRSHWRAPMIMLGGLITGAGFALGHHFFNTSIDMQPVDDVPFSQAWVIRLGTLLAFLVKISFAATIGSAFVQLQWFQLRKEPRTIKDIDTLSSILSNILSCFDSTWLQHQGLALLAVLFWLLPILPLITPSTLNVKSLTQRQNMPLIVPRFTPGNTSEDWPWGFTSENQSSAISGVTPSPGLVQVYLPVAFGAKISPMIPQYPNESFHLDFNAPAINCSQADESLALSMTVDYGLSSTNYNTIEDPGYPIYYSWVGGDQRWGKSGSYPMNVDFTSQDAARLFVLYLPQSFPAPNVTIDGTLVWLPNIIECSLYNASYSVDFSYTNSEQITNANISFLNNVRGDPESDNVALRSYTAMMAGLGNLLVGSIWNMTDGGDLDGYLDAPTSRSTQYTQAESLSQIFTDGFDIAENISSNIEEMFQNMTLSLATSSRPYFTTNQTVMGTVTSTLVTYTYRPLDLFLTYGIAFILSLLSAAAGFYGFIANDGSYQNIFSTFLRATKYTGIAIDSDDVGADPRPRDLSRAKVKVTPGDT